MKILYYSILFIMARGLYVFLYLELGNLMYIYYILNILLLIIIMYYFIGFINVLLNNALLQILYFIMHRVRWMIFIFKIFMNKNYYMFNNILHGYQNLLEIYHIFDDIISII